VVGKNGRVTTTAELEWSGDLPFHVTVKR